MTQKQLRDLNTIVETYGSDKQEDMAIEECSELIKAILKFRRSNAKDSDLRDAVIDEIADVQIMLTQLGIIFNCVEEVNERIDFKIDRWVGLRKERQNVMFVKSQDGAVVLNNDRVTEYSTDSKYDGRYKVAALVGENRVVIGRYSTKEKCRMAISMLMDCYTMNLLFERGQDENPRDLVCEYVADQPLGVFEMPQEDEIE